MTSIEITTPDGAQQFILQSDNVTIGRLAANDIVLPYSHISRRHAELRILNGIWWVADMSSTNGLHVGGLRVPETPLETGAIIELSPHVSLRLLPTPTPPIPQPAPMSTSPDAQLTPLAALAPRSPYAEDETPYYPHMRPAPTESRPRPARPSAPRLDAYSNSPRRPLPSSADQPSNAAVHQAATDALDHQRHAEELSRRHRTATGAPSTVLHICQTCGQRTAPDAVYCQSCHHAIAAECPNCRLSLLPIQDMCPRCQTPNPGSVRRGRRSTR